MNSDNIPDKATNNLTQANELELEKLNKELQEIHQKTEEFERLIQTHLIHEIIEEQELSLLYKRLKKEKKEKRLEQKRRGKNYKTPQGIIKTSVPKAEDTNSGELKERKRMYREAMFKIHPDLFSNKEDKLELVTELTTQLIDIFHSGDDEKLKEFYTQVCKGGKGSKESTANTPVDHNSILELKINQLKKDIEAAKTKATYVILCEYENPYLYIDELKTYYTDRLQKLRKRTRKARK